MAPKRQRQRKPHKYPKKLRHTLERIRDKPDADESDEGVGHTLWREFYAKDAGGTTQIKVMHGLIDDAPVDEKHHRLHITNHLDVNETRVKPPKPMTIAPPWKWKVRSETPGSE